MTSERLDAVRATFDDAGVDAVLITNLTNVRYLVGFTGSNAALVVGRETVTLLTDGRYELQATVEVEPVGEPVDVRLGSGDLTEAVREAVAASMYNGAPSARLGFETTQITVAHHARLEAALADVELVGIAGTVEALRARKDGAEIECMRAAAALADAALAEVRPAIRAGIAERALAVELESTVRRLGANRPAFDTIVASGPNGAKPHHRPGDRMLEADDLVIIDFGAELDGYRSDMTRSFFLGTPSGQAADMLEAVRIAQQAGVDTVGADVPIAAIDGACRGSLEAAGLAEYFTHGTGHGVGLDIHEAPWVNAKATGILAPGHVITVEPGVYVPGLGGVRWEDTVVVTETGADPLTRTEKQPVVA